MPVSDYFAGIRDAFPASRRARRDYRLYDECLPDLGAYYVRWFGSADGAHGDAWKRRAVDSSGVALTRGGYRPTDIFRFGLEAHADWLRGGDGQDRARFLAQARWAQDAQSPSGTYPFATGWKRYGCPPGFLSATAQGQAISLLLRAYQATGDDRFLQRAAGAAVPFLRTVTHGGVSWNDGEGGMVFEAAAIQSPAHALGGWVYALWGLFELSRVVADDRVTALYCDGLATLRRYLPRYDAGTWSYAHLGKPRAYASVRAHGYHVAQLHVLASMTGDECYAGMALRWQSFLDSRRSRALAGLGALATIGSILPSPPPIGIREPGAS